MPLNNQFRHQVYQSSPPDAPYELLIPPSQPAVDSPEFRQQLQTAGTIYRSSGVAAIFLLHGTFMGADAFGWIRKLRRISASIGDRFEVNVKGLLDLVMADAGNYTADYAQRLEVGLAGDDGERIPVRLCLWSSENHHIGRADGAIRLLNEMLVQPPNSRVLVFSHSHGGNVMALVTNLLAADERLRQRFFEACSSYYRWPWTTRIHTAAWQNVMAAFADPDRCARLRSVALDIVTFGTPIRYGWDVGGCDHLLHFVNHRPQPNLPPYLAAMPRKFDDVLHAISGDYIQQFGIAGSSLPPTPISWRTAVANRRLRSLLQTNLKSKQLTARFTSGMRVPNDGLTVLVDYQDAGTAFATNLAGHAVYTRRQWMAFHALQIAQRFYGCSR